MFASDLEPNLSAEHDLRVDSGCFFGSVTAFTLSVS